MLLWRPNSTQSSLFLLPFLVIWAQSGCLPQTDLYLKCFSSDTSLSSRFPLFLNCSHFYVSRLPCCLLYFLSSPSPFYQNFPLSFSPSGPVFLVSVSLSHSLLTLSISLVVTLSKWYPLLHCPPNSKAGCWSVCLVIWPLCWPRYWHRGCWLCHRKRGGVSFTGNVVRLFSEKRSREAHVWGRKTYF
jgi:hypothetical protein